MKSLVMVGGMNLCDNSSVTIEDCNVTAGEWAAVMVQSGTTITIISGTYTAREDYKASSSAVSLAENSGSVATIQGGTFNGNPVAYSGTSYIATGGKFTFKKSGYWDFFTIPSGYKVIDSSGKIGGVQHSIKEVVPVN